MSLKVALFFCLVVAVVGDFLGQQNFFIPPQAYRPLSAFPHYPQPPPPPQVRRPLPLPPPQVRRPLPRPPPQVRRPLPPPPPQVRRPLPPPPPQVRRPLPRPQPIVFPEAPQPNYYPNTIPQYSYSYGVLDDLFGVNFGAEESRDGDLTQGSYFVNLPDGRTQVVTYSDYGDGLIAEVTYDGVP